MTNTPLPTIHSSRARTLPELRRFLQENLTDALHQPAALRGAQPRLELRLSRHLLPDTPEGTAALDALSNELYRQGVLHGVHATQPGEPEPTTHRLRIELSANSKNPNVAITKPQSCGVCPKELFMTANTFANDTNLPSFMHTPPLAKTRVSSLLAWLMGDAPAHPAQDPNANEPTLLKPDDVLVEPPQPPDGNFWVESFFNALTEATTLFAKRHVALLHNEDPSIVYSVREVKIQCQGAPAQFLRDVASLPQNVRNGVIKSRMHKAAGAQELLALDNFYGSTLVTDISMVEGQVVQTLVSYSGCRFALKFAFEGDYLTRPVPAPASFAAPATITAPATPPAASEASEASEATVFYDSADHCTRLRSDHPADRSGAMADGTVLRTDQAPTTQPIATLRLRSLDAEFSMPLLEGDFPFTIGRHASFKGYSVRSHKAAQCTQILLAAEPANFASFVSREHLVLHGYDSHTRQFRVMTVQGRNGSHFKNAPANGPFLLPLADMESHWLKLGGNSGDGILEIKIEAV